MVAKSNATFSQSQVALVALVTKIETILKVQTIGGSVEEKTAVVEKKTAVVEKKTEVVEETAASNRTTGGSTRINDTQAQVTKIQTVESQTNTGDTYN